MRTPCLRHSSKTQERVYNLYTVSHLLNVGWFTRQQLFSFAYIYTYLMEISHYNANGHVFVCYWGRRGYRSVEVADGGAWDENNYKWYDIQ